MYMIKKKENELCSCTFYRKELSQCREFMDKLGIECQQTEKALEEALRQNM